MSRMSLSGEETRKAAQITLEAIRQAGTRAVIKGWDEILEGTDLPENIYHCCISIEMADPWRGIFVAIALYWRPRLLAFLMVVQGMKTEIYI